ncbi:MAG: xylulokinase, partial [Chloroflexi bacterium]|nr:xylulokinase [Chloroflexota bacterium]
HHTVGHLARAVMEGVTFAMDECLSLVIEAADDPNLEVTITGGAASSPVWRQMQADIYRRPLALAGGANHGSVGAALLAGVGSGLYASFEEACARLPRAAALVEPNPATAEIYQSRREHYRGLYARLKDDMHRLQSL